MLTEFKTEYEHYFVDERDLLQGKYIHFYENGNIFSMCHMVDNILHGEYTDFYKNGQIWEHAFYHHGDYHGEYMRYSDTGVLRKHTFYYRGVDLEIDPATLSGQDKLYIMMCGRLPPRD